MRKLFTGLLAIAMAASFQVSAQNAYEAHSEYMYTHSAMKYSVDKIAAMGFEKWQSGFRDALKEKLGLTVIEAQTEGFIPHAVKLREEDAGFAIRQWWSITTEPEVEIPFILLIPKDMKGPAPLMITPHGHSPNSELSAGIYRSETDRFKGEEGERNVAVQAVQHGFIAIAPTARGFASTRRQKDIDEGSTSSCRDLACRDALVGRTPVGDRVWDIMKLIDWALETLPVDGRNIIVSGNSGGGTATLYAGAVDTRISISVPSCAFCDFSLSIGHRKHCDCNYIPGIMTLADMGEIAGLTAPRAFCTINGKEDAIFPIEGARKAFEVTRSIYRMVGAEQDCSMYEGDGGHRYYKKGAWDFILPHLKSATETPEDELPAWSEGMLDLHFISTGSGNCSFCVLPDGTTLLVDAGDLGRPDSRAPLRKPDSSRSVGEWIADYIRHFSPDGDSTRLDYAFITHFHDDHIGSAQNAHGYANGYPLTGISEVGTILPIGKFIDRGYDFPVNIDSDTTKAARVLRKELAWYRDFIEYQCSANGMQYEKAKVGSESQIKLLRHPEAYPDFKVRVLFANGQVAHKTREKVASSKFKAGEYPGENNLSTGFRLDYGDFNFYTGGDIPGIGHTGATDPQSMEARVAAVIGPVDVAVLNHHGNRDTQNAEYVATLCPRVWIGESWGIRHPGEEVIRRITSRYIYPEDRDVYATYMAPANMEFMNRYTRGYKSTSGHIVVRVAPGGASYDVYVLDDSNSFRKVKSVNHYNSK